MSHDFSQKEIEEFKTLLEKETETILSNDDLLGFMTQIFNLIKSAYSPINKKEYEEIKKIIIKLK